MKEPDVVFFPRDLGHTKHSYTTLRGVLPGLELFANKSYLLTSQIIQCISMFAYQFEVAYQVPKSNLFFVLVAF